MRRCPVEPPSARSAGRRRAPPRRRNEPPARAPSRGGSGARCDAYRPYPRDDPGLDPDRAPLRWPARARDARHAYRERGDGPTRRARDRRRPRPATRQRGDRRPARPGRSHPGSARCDRRRRAGARASMAGCLDHRDVVAHPPPRAAPPHRPQRRQATAGTSARRRRDHRHERRRERRPGRGRRRPTTLATGPWGDDEAWQRSPAGPWDPKSMTATGRHRGTPTARDRGRR